MFIRVYQGMRGHWAVNYTGTQSFHEIEKLFGLVVSEILIDRQTYKTLLIYTHDLDLRGRGH